MKRRSPTNTLTYWTIKCQNKNPTGMEDILDELTHAGRDRIPMELREAAMTTRKEISAAFARAMNKAMMN